MTYLKKLVVATLLTVWTFPAVGQAHTQPPAEIPGAPAAPAQAPAPSPALGAMANTLAGGTEASQLAARERQAPELKDFRGGAVSIYIGSGAALVLIIVLLIILF